MFTLRYIQTLFSIISHNIDYDPKGYETYVYLEDSDESVTFHLRNWNRWAESSVTNQDVVIMNIFNFLDKRELYFLLELWTSIEDVTGIK